MPKLKRDLTVAQQLAKGPVDLPYLALVLLLTGIGVIMVFSASYASAYYDSLVAKNDPMYYFLRQAGFAAAGIAAMFIVSKINYQRFRWMSVFVLGLAFVLLVLVIPFGYGRETVGAQRWIQIGPINFQPSEIAKIGVIMYFAARMSKRGTVKERKWNKRSLLGRFLAFLDKIGLLELLPYLAILLAIVVLLYFEPHMSGTILILVGGAAVLFAGGVRIFWFLAGGGVFVGLIALIIATTDYMTARIQYWQNPWLDYHGSGYQTIQSLYAIGSGGLLGLGLGKSHQKFLYLPEPENDYIFPIVCEELGFIGALLVLLLFVLLILRGYWLALHARDRFGALLIVGINTLLAAQVFLNVAVVTNLIPSTGISLPFFSYGGTALVIQLAEMGIVLSVSRQITAPKEGG